MLDFVGKIRFWMVFFQQKNLGGYQLSSSKWWKTLDKTPLSPGSDLEKNIGIFNKDPRLGFGRSKRTIVLL